MQKGWPIPTQVGGWQHLTGLLHTAATPTMSEFCALMRRCAVELLRQSEEDRSRLRPNGDARTMEAIIWEYNDRDQSSRQRPKTSGTFGSARNFRALMALQVEWKRHISKGSRNHRHKADQAHFKRLVRKGGTGGGATNARKTTPTPDRLLCVPESLYQL
jgi:hypothetical protein